MNTTDAIMSLVDEIDCDEPPKDFETHMERRAAIRASIDALVKERDEALAACRMKVRN